MILIQFFVTIAVNFKDFDPISLNMTKYSKLMIQTLFFFLHFFNDFDSISLNYIKLIKIRVNYTYMIIKLFTHSTLKKNYKMIVELL